MEFSELQAHSIHMTDPTFHTAACVTIEKTIQAALRYDPGSRYALERLHGQVLAIDLAQPELRKQCLIAPYSGVVIQVARFGHPGNRMD